MFCPFLGISLLVLHTFVLPLQAAVGGTNYYEEYTGIELPLKKLDFMGIPGAGGAVENWGLIQFDERRMLVNEVSDLQCCWEGRAWGKAGMGVGG